MKKIMAISKKYKIPVVEDACQGILSSFNKKTQVLGVLQVVFLCIL